MHIKLQWVQLTWGLFRACAACPTPRLNLKFELRPSWNNIHDRFATGNAQDTTPKKNIQFVNDEKCNFSAMTMSIVVEISTNLFCKAGGTRTSIHVACLAIPTNKTFVIANG